MTRRPLALKPSQPYPPPSVTVTYSPPVSNVANTNTAIQDYLGNDASSFTSYSVYTGYNLPVNTVNLKSFTAPVNSQIAINGLGLKDAWGATNDTYNAITTLSVKSGTLQLLASAATNSISVLDSNGNSLTATNGYYTGSSIVIKGTLSQINAFLSTPGDVLYTAPASYLSTGDVLTISSRRFQLGYMAATDVDSISIVAPGGTGLGMSMGPIYLRQGLNGSAIGLNGKDN